MDLQTIWKLLNTTIARLERLTGRSFMFDRTMKRDLYVENDDNLVVSGYIDLNGHDIIMSGDNCEICFVE